MIRRSVRICQYVGQSRSSPLIQKIITGPCLWIFMTEPPCPPHTSSSLLFILFLWLLYVYVSPRSRTDAILPDKRDASYNIPAGVPGRLACDPGCNSSNREPSPTPHPAPSPSCAAAVVQGQPDGFRSRGATAIVITRLIGLSVFMAASDLSELKHSAGSDPLWLCRQ